MEGRKTALSKDDHILTLGICEYVTLYSKRDFANVIKVKDLEMRGLPKGAKSNHMGP